ncbi:MAG: DUF2855 family protein [Hyphomonadaceae bacterium]|jgi:hypothetical protein|nr:DUF2855 family protein [Hyphomonadaceae bacterium]
MRAMEMHRATLSDVRWHEEADSALQDGQARLALSRFALTANNVTYAVFGDRMAYWNFFPASTPELGRVPVWGFGDVIESRCEGITVGQRVYGFFPVADTLVVEPGKVSARGFTDMSATRQPMSALYNGYETASPTDADTEARICLLRPLFLTGWLIDRWLGDHDFFGARRVVASAASSKTALALASGLAQRSDIEAVGLTSARSRGFVEATGLYNRAVTYGEEASLGDGVPTIYVDFAGSQTHTRAVHTACGEALLRSVAVGGADWAAERTAEAIPGPQPALFFAPAVAAEMVGTMGGAAFATQTAAALQDAIQNSHRWLEVHDLAGLDQAGASWGRLLDNDVGPEVGLVVTLGTRAG